MLSFAWDRDVGSELAQVLLHESGLQWLLEIVSDLGGVAGHLAVVSLGIVLGGDGDRVRDQVDAAYASAVKAHFVMSVVLGVHWRGALLSPTAAGRGAALS